MGAALQRFAAVAWVSFTDREPEVVLPTPGPGRAANFTFFLTHDAPAVRLHQLDVPTLQGLASRIVVGLGRDPASRGPGKCALALAALLHCESAAFAGTHNGWLTHPKAFAAQLDEVLRRPPPGS
jgi:hypothetical protein